MCAPPRIEAVTVAAVPSKRSPGWALGLARSREGFAKKRFPRCADYDGAAETGEFGKARENFKILLVLFSKPDSRIEQELRFGEARAFRARDRLAQSGRDIPDYVARERPLLHRPRRSAHVHEDQRRAGVSRNFREARVGAQRRNVIENFGAGIEGRFRDLRTSRVHGHRNAQLAPQLLDYGQNAPKLFLRGNRSGAGARRFAADIEDVRAVVLELQCARDGCFRIEIFSAVGETIRRDIQNAHDQGALHRESVCVSGGGAGIVCGET